MANAQRGARPARTVRFAPIRSARFTLPPRPWRAAPPATPGPGRQPPPPVPAPPPPEIQEPPPNEIPLPVHEPPTMPPPVGLTLALLRPDVYRATTWTKCSLRTASDDSTNG